MDFFFALVMPFLPFFGGEVLLCWAVAYLGTLRWRGYRTGGVFGASFLLLLLIWCIANLVQEYPLLLGYLSYPEAVDGLFSLATVQQFLFFCQVSLSFQLFLFWAKFPELRRRTLFGMSIGGFGAILCSGLQAVAWMGALGDAPRRWANLLPHQTELWNELARPVGIFSDPNAMGIFCGLYLVVLAVQYGTFQNLLEGRVPRWFFCTGYFLLVAVTVGVGLVSGSRSFLLFVCSFVTTSFFLYGWNQRKRGALLLPRRSWFWMVVATFLFTGGLVVLFTDTLSSFRAVERVSLTLQFALEGDFSRFANRFYFSILCWEMFLDFPLVGIGPLQFPSLMTSYAALLDLPIGLWRDNVNNSYLGFLAEYGVYGLLLLILALRRSGSSSSLRWRSQEGDGVLLTGAGVAFLMILFFGPHYYFGEVAFLLALLAAGVMTPLRRDLSTECSRPSVGRSEIVLLCCSTVLIFQVTNTQEYGLYPWERGAEEHVYRWSQQHFRTWVLCREGKAVLRLRNPQPRSLTVQPAVGSWPFQHRVPSKVLSSGESRDFVFTCGQDVAYRGVPIEVSLSHVWRPENGDLRVLGVQVFTGQVQEPVLARRIDKGW
ncbi:O-antigen ligase family protein [bacterium]|nr:O-antigen ligase family protein [bacterium]